MNSLVAEARRLPDSPALSERPNISSAVEAFHYFVSGLKNVP